MTKYGGKRFNSRWDNSTWFLLACIAACCVGPVFLDDGIWPVVISVVVLMFIIVVLRSVYYRIDGTNLIVYQFFIPHVYPIAKISEVQPTKDVLSAPATSLPHRIAIRFSDRENKPLIISPVREQEFIENLLAVNPDIKC